MKSSNEFDITELRLIHMAISTQVNEIKALNDRIGINIDVPEQALILSKIELMIKTKSKSK